MSETIKLDAPERTQFGKGAARKLRATGMTPAVIYGHGADPVHVSIETHPLSLVVRQANALIDLNIDGKSQLVLVKDVQRDPVRQIIEHVDLQMVRKGETVEVEVPVVLVGETFPGTMAVQEINVLTLSVPATSIPETIEVDVDGKEDGFQLIVAELPVPPKSTVLDDPEQLVVKVSIPTPETDEDETDEETTEVPADNGGDSSEESEESAE